MKPRTWVVFCVVVLLGELGTWGGPRLSWSGRHIQTLIGIGVWFIGNFLLMPGRFLIMLFRDWVPDAAMAIMDLSMAGVLLDIGSNLIVWFLCAKLIGLIKSRVFPAIKSTAQR